ncbi:MAG: Wzz/FepE/Etk N-terminal domain-containing protein [Clostridiales bacterium]|nr:Wzz/FepE/Etk N-terminal domain-containing protein [Clostridiales bacterium]
MTEEKRSPEENSLAVRPAYLIINFKAMFMVVLDKLVFILLAGILTGLLVYPFYIYVIRPDYVSTTKIYVLPQGTESSVSYADLEVGSQLTNDYIEIVQGRTVVEAVIEYFDLDETYEEFCKRLTVENQSDTRILTISVKDKDPVAAKTMAAYLREYAVDEIVSNMGIEGVTVIEDANLPTRPVLLPVVVSVIAGILMWVLMTVFICFYYVIIDRIVSADDIEERLGLPVLGTIMLDKKIRRRRR